MFGQIMTVLVIYPIKYRMISQENITIRCCLNPSFTAMLPSLWQLNIAKITNVHHHLLKSWFVPLFSMVIFNSQGGSNSPPPRPLGPAHSGLAAPHSLRASTPGPAALAPAPERKIQPLGVQGKMLGETVKHRKNLGIHFLWTNKSRD